METIGQVDLKKAYRKTVIDEVGTLNIKSPISAQFEMTFECNYSCGFCYNVWGRHNPEKKIRRSLTFKECKRVIQKLIEMEILDLIFSGGEPLLKQYLSQLIKIASKTGIETSLITNGYFLSEDTVKELKDAGLSGMQISFHHFDKEVVDQITERPGSYEKTLAGIENVLKIFGAEHLNVNMVPFNKTHRDVFSMAKFLADKGVRSFSTGALFHINGKLDNDLTINKSQFREVVDQLKKAKAELNISPATTGGFPLCVLPKINKEILDIVANYCDAGINQIVIAPDGDMRPCVCYNQTVGNILKDDPAKIWREASFLKRLRKLEHVPPKCYSCKHVYLCKGGCRASAFACFGDLQALDPLEVL